MLAKNKNYFILQSSYKNHIFEKKTITDSIFVCEKKLGLIID